MIKVYYAKGRLKQKAGEHAGGDNEPLNPRLAAQQITYIVHALGVEGKLRHAEIARRLPGVTQRMLTRSLRQLERDGLIARHDHGEVPPRVDYELTPLGRSFLAQMVPLWMWLLEHAEDFRVARVRFGEV
ncbi:helix-turn-helix transcriptional regulator [Pseudomonas sp. Z3-8]